MKMFGCHLEVNNAEKLSLDVEGTVKYLAPLGVTHLILEIDNCFMFQSHPEISCSDITADQLRDCCDRMREAGNTQNNPTCRSVNERL